MNKHVFEVKNSKFRDDIMLLFEDKNPVKQPINMICMILNFQN